MKVTSYAAGTPCWIDLRTRDVPATIAFYSALFGWVGFEGPPEVGGYAICNLDDVPVAGIGPLMAEGQLSAWMSYFASDDLDDTASRVAKAGGQVMMAPMDVMDVGRMAVFMDSSGAAFGGWQKRNFYGAGVVNEPGALIWNELLTRDVDGSKEFYATALGLEAKASDVSGDMPYTEWMLDDRSVAGMMSMDIPQFPADVPPNWVVYFAVVDVDASTARVTELGGSVTVPPTVIPIGTFSAVSDPGGASFSMIQMAA